MANHDGGEERENDTRRDDVLENDVQVSGREFQRGSDSYAEDRDLRRRGAEQTFANNQRLFEQSFQQTDKLNSLAERTREDDRVALEDRDIVRFRGASFGQVATSALEGQVATVGEEEMENVPDEDNANTGTPAGGRR